MNESAVRSAMRDELAEVYYFVEDSPTPTVNAVIDETLMDVARELRETASSYDQCDSVDNCTTKAIYLRHLADRMDPQNRAELSAPPAGYEHEPS